jgi:hypothetical protein
MTDFSATDAAFTGIRFVREHVRTVAIWAGFQIVISLVLGALFIVGFGPTFTQMQSLNQPGAAPDPAQIMGLFGRLLPMYAVLLVFSLAFYSVLYAAVSRAVLRPAEEGFAYIRFGMDEARQCLLLLLTIVLVLAAEIVAGVVIAVPAAITAIAAKSFMPLVLFVCCVAAGAAGVWVLVRLSLAVPLTFDSRRVNLFGSWALTRGHFWKMLGTYLLVLGIALVIFILTLIIVVCVATVLGGLGAVASIFRPNMVSLEAFFAPARIGVSLIWALVTPLFWALFFMPAPEIYRHLRER